MLARNLRIFLTVISLIMSASVSAADTSGGTGEKTVSGAVTALETHGQVITIEDQRLSMIVGAQIVDEKDNARTFADLLPGVMVTATLDASGKVKKIKGIFPPSKK